MDTFIARFWWGLFYVLTLGLFTIHSDDAAMDFIGWPYALTRWWKRRKH